MQGGLTLEIHSSSQRVFAEIPNLVTATFVRVLVCVWVSKLPSLNLRVGHAVNLIEVGTISRRTRTADVIDEGIRLQLKHLDI